MASTRTNMMTTTVFLLLSLCFLSLYISTTSASSILPETLYKKGYFSMSIILENTLNRLISSAPSNTTAFTIFAPTEVAFLKLFPKYPDPPYRLIQYHVVPSELDRESLETSLPLGSKVDTLLPGHPIVVTSLARHEKASINYVEVAEWDVYNDGRVIVHGVEEFFDPAYEILRHPGHAIHPNAVLEKDSQSIYGFLKRSLFLGFKDWS